jgi:hypothetical protein
MEDSDYMYPRYPKCLKFIMNWRRYGGTGVKRRPNGRCCCQAWNIYPIKQKLWHMQRWKASLSVGYSYMTVGGELRENWVKVWKGSQRFSRRDDYNVKNMNKGLEIGILVEVFPIASRPIRSATVARPCDFPFEEVCPLRTCKLPDLIPESCGPDSPEHNCHQCQANCCICFQNYVIKTLQSKRCQANCHICFQNYVIKTLQSRTVIGVREIAAFASRIV